MKLALIGYGKMGRMIHRNATARDHSVQIIDPHAPEADATTVTAESLKGCSVAIHFTSPDVFESTARSCIEAGCNLVVGTTGWYDREEQIKELVAKHTVGFLYSPNFSIGVNAFFSIVNHAAALIDKLDDYDVAGLEYHHRHKEDSPSGTALALTDIILSQIERKKTAVFDRLDRAPKADEVHFSSVRCGTIAGTHSLTFDAAEDTISLQHTARSREGFALGAVKAAEWLAGRQGFYTMDAFMQHILHGTFEG